MENMLYREEEQLRDRITHKKKRKVNNNNNVSEANDREGKQKLTNAQEA